MPELRQSRVTKDWVIIATERAKRPDEFRLERQKKELPEHDMKCPFCPGNEHMTPAETLAFRSGLSTPNGPGWRLRVVPNKFSALVPTGSFQRHPVDGFYRRMDGIGIHEIIIESPQHNVSPATMPETQVEEIFLAYRERYNAIWKDGRFRMVIIFRNHGPSAGTSMEHPHSQLIATPIVPTHIRHLLEEAMRYFDDHGSCVFCDTVSVEKKVRKRIILEAENFLVYAPYASQSPFETIVMPKKHYACFGSISEQETRELANVVRVVLQQIHEKLNDPDYNLVIHTAPFKDANEDFYHWHVQIFPRLTTTAGFELGSGIHITTALPEESAKFLRIEKQ